MPFIKPLFKAPLKKLATKSGQSAAKAAMHGAYSSAHKKLKGTTMLLEGWDAERVVDSVLNLGGKRRAITFTDGTFMNTTADFIHEQAQIIGSGKHVPQVVEQGKESVLEYALAALDRNAKAYQTGALNEFWTKKMVRNEHKGYLRQVKATGAKTVPYVLVEYNGRLVPMSQQYADVLVGEGIVKIHKGR